MRPRLLGHRYHFVLTRNNNDRKKGNVHSISKEVATAPMDPEFVQFARIDAGLLAWNFVLEDSRRLEIASVTRGFRGWGREVSNNQTRAAAPWLSTLTESAATWLLYRD